MTRSLVAKVDCLSGLTTRQLAAMVVLAMEALELIAKGAPDPSATARLARLNVALLSMQKCEP